MRWFWRLHALGVALLVAATAAFGQHNRPSGAAAACDTYAAYPLDQQRRGPGVPFDKLDPQLAIPACEAAVRQSPKDYRLIFQLGRAYHKAQNFAAAITQYRKAAEEGFASAQNNLGNMYRAGEGVPKDLVEAVAWYRKAAEQGFAPAQDSLSQLAQVIKRVDDLGNMGAGEVKALQQRLTDGSCYTGAIDGQRSTELQRAITECPSQDPVLRIETGMHVAAINRIGVDRACRIAATGSDDKTVRVWSLPDGRLLRTLRVPIGPGRAGAIFATAVSPDGRWIAAGGWGDAPGATYVYVFDTATGAVVARVGPFGFSNVIHNLAFSPDGRWLAATSSTSVGLKVIDAQTWQIVAGDAAYNGESYGAAFAPDGRLYTVAYDGKLREYGPGPEFKKEREVVTQSGKQPHFVAVDPRGQLVAVGFGDVAKVDVYDAAMLRFRFAVDALFSVAWISDGAQLIAGGYPLRTFSRDGQLVGKPLPLAHNTIMGLQSCGSAIAVAAADPAFGLIDGNGQIELWKTGVAPDMRGKREDAFAIAQNAKQVRMGLGEGPEDPVLFDLERATVTSAPNLLPAFLTPSTEGLPVSNWRSDGLKPGTDVNPTFAGKPIQGEPTRSLAIRKDHTGFVLGGFYSLRAFDAQGRQLWQQPGPGNAWGVNLSLDGRIVVVAYEDGTIRWRRWSDGTELLALFIDRADKRWVAWTPTGYYMASPGGEDLIGWHLNRGWNQSADFFPASRFRDRFNRPDIVHLVLETLDEDAAIKQANEIARRKEDTRPLIDHLPPIIRIANPDGARVSEGTVKLNYSVRSPSGQAVDQIDVVINGRPIKGIGLPVRPADPNVETTGSVDVPLTQHFTEVGLIAWTNDLASEAAHIRVTWDGAPEATRKLYALVVGVSQYAEPDMALTYAAKDARDFTKALQDQKEAGFYTDVETRVITDGDVTRGSVIEGLQWLEKMATNPNDVSVLFLAGHGLTDDKGTYWFLPADANADDVRAKGVSQEELRQSLQGLSGKVLWFLDTCHAGRAAKRPPPDINLLVNKVSAVENGGIVVFASSTGREASVENPSWGNGAFTKAVVEGIERGEADLFKDGFITTQNLGTFVAHRVSSLTGGQQNPVMQRPPEEPDFAIAEVRK
jgi:hypothetical protein